MPLTSASILLWKDIISDQLSFDLDIYKRKTISFQYVWGALNVQRKPVVVLTSKVELIEHSSRKPINEPSIRVILNLFNDFV